MAKGKGSSGGGKSSGGGGKGGGGLPINNHCKPFGGRDNAPPKSK